MSKNRLLSLVLLNIVVSAAVVLTILWWWDGRNEEVTPVFEPTIAAPLAQPIGTTLLPTAETIVQETAVAEPEAEELPTHVVKPGDTLGKIGEQYGVPTEDIAEMNNIIDANILSVGEVLLIPINGVPTPASVVEETAVEATNTPLPPIPTIEGVDGIVILEIREVTGVGELDAETVQIVNSGNYKINLQGWQLADQNGHFYTFGNVVLFGEGAGIQIHSAGGTDTFSDLFWAESAPIWRSGETATLLDANGTVQVEYIIP